VLDHQAADMTVTVEAGCPLPTLAATLASAGQWLPLDPPTPAATTVGGLLAANLAGPLRGSQGRVRDLLLGLRVIAADGALVTSGGRVVKNVAGYDLGKLHVGALGTVGVIVEATFKVRPRPLCEEALLVACAGVREAAETARVLWDGPVEPFWLEVLGPGVFPGELHAAAVVLGLAGIPEEVTEGRARVRELLRTREQHPVAVADGPGLRQQLADVSRRSCAAVLRASTLPTEVGPAMEALARGGVRVAAHFATGSVRAAVETADAAIALVHELRPSFEGNGGSLVVERGVPEVKARVQVWGEPGPGFPLMRSIKEAFDPDRLLAPGRQVGGL
jgi:glycolate oxidase FAD binding subunit